jgi:hypothetical protein
MAMPRSGSKREATLPSQEVERLNARGEFLERLLEAGAGPSGERQIRSGEKSTGSGDRGDGRRADDPNGV